MARTLKCRTPEMVFKFVLNGSPITVTFDQGIDHDEASVPDDAVALLLACTTGDLKVYDPNPEPMKQAAHDPVQDITGLKSIDNYLDQQLCFVEDIGLFRYDAQSTDVPDDVNCVKPDSIDVQNPGRWIKLTGNIESLPWGKISGTLANQADLNLALSEKAGVTDLSVHEAAVSNVHGVGPGTIAKVSDISVDTNLSAEAQDAVTKKHDGAAQDTVINGKASLVGADDIEITINAKGVILRSGNGTRYRLRVSNSGSLSTEVVA